ncbi:linear amide C-N hydrolase [Nocardia rhizosphaerae]|uniref:Linear amide C-N hydrolase n=1 Tax=Nocardia rhizosphaerae TaxID=1691571 RepID=A0ABV8L2L9_9NOCA
MFSADSYLVPAAPDDYLSVRAMTVRGTNTEIGSDLGGLAQRDYHAAIAPYADPAYGRGRLAYLDRNYPALGARARGVADAFGVSASLDEHDTTTLAFDVPGGVPGCSLVWFPPTLTSTGRPMFGRNMDWFIGPLSTQLGLAPGPDEHPSCSRAILLTTVPATGRPVATLGSHDLLNPALDGVNDAGLMMAVLVDHSDRGNVGASLTGGYTSGLTALQVPGCVLSAAATVAEAKTTVLTQSIFCAGATNMHWFIADAHGAATVLEIDGDSRQYRFIDAEPDRPFVVTNHALHRYPTIDTFPQSPIGAEHNSFVRYQVLTDAIAAHRGPWTPADISALLDVVLCAYVDDKAAGIAGSVPERTLWHYLADPVERGYRFRFYQRDLDQEPGTNHLRIRRTEPIAWDLGGALGAG